MRKLVTILLILVSLNSYTQSLDSIPNTTETERIIDKYGGQLVESFSKFMDTATPMAQEGFKMVVRLQIAKGIGMLLPLLVMFIISFFIPKIIKKSEWYDGDPINSWAILQIVSWICLAVLTVTSIFTVYDGILHIIAPEWFAIKEIMGLF